MKRRWINGAVGGHWNRWLLLWVTTVMMSSPVVGIAAEGETAGAAPWRIAVVSSYHREYLWSQDTHRGVVSALKEAEWIGNDTEAERYTRNDFLENDRVVLKKLWMDSKRKSSRAEMKSSAARIVQQLDWFQPDLIMLGDDNATNLIGNHYLDKKVPVVTWGVNGIPLKYGLVNSLEYPGHNVTGTYQAGYLKESIESLKSLFPHIQIMAILSDGSTTGRSKARELRKLWMDGLIPVRIEHIVVTNRFSDWKNRAKALEGEVDAFFVLNHNTLKNERGEPVSQMEAGRWYLENIRKPEVAHEKQFVEEGLLSAVDDSGFKQGEHATQIAIRILQQGEDPATIAMVPPERGAFLLNRQRADQLKLDQATINHPIVEAYIDRSMALE